MESPAIVVPLAVERADWAALWREMYPAMVRLAYLLTGSLPHAEDCVQDAFVAVQRSRVAISEPGAYLRVCVVNQCKRWRGRESRVELRQVDDGAALTNERDHELASQLGRLPEKLRTALVLRYYEDLTFAQIAEMLQCAEATARSQVHRGLKQLRELMS